MSFKEDTVATMDWMRMDLQGCYTLSVTVLWGVVRRKVPSKRAGCSFHLACDDVAASIRPSMDCKRHALEFTTLNLY